MKIVCVMVSTADGIIAKHSGHNVDWSSPEDKAMFTAETIKHQAVILGISTYQAIGRMLPKRYNLVLTQNPKDFKNQAVPDKLEFFSGTPQAVIEFLENKGYQSAALIGGGKTNAEFFKAGLVDELMLTIEPKLFGQGLNLTGNTDFELSLKLREFKKLNANTVWLHYQVIKD